MSTVLIVDDADDLTFSLRRIVTKEGYTVAVAASGSEALDVLRTHIVELIFLDIGLPDINGNELIPQIREISADSDIIMLTGNNDAKTAVESLKAGALDYIVKPFDLLEFTTALQRSMDTRLVKKKVMLAAQSTGRTAMISESKVMLPVKEAICTAAQVSSPVLITGETGTGKEIAARSIADQQSHDNGLFVKIDCGTLSAHLIESELFGHEKGAFTDAQRTKKGLVEIADGGTLFLDEIGNLPLLLQPKLLRLVAESTFRRVGGMRDIQVSVRIIAATNTNIAKQVASGKFRADLFYRLNVIPIDLPPLRDRSEDIILLANYYLHFFNIELKKNIKGFTRATVNHMHTYSWPGNIRELRNMIERKMIFCKSEWLSFVGGDNLTENDNCMQLMRLRDVERAYVQKVLLATGNNKSKAAKILGITRNTLRTKLQNGQ